MVFIDILTQCIDIYKIHVHIKLYFCICFLHVRCLMFNRRAIQIQCIYDSLLISASYMLPTPRCFLDHCLFFLAGWFVLGLLKKHGNWSGFLWGRMYLPERLLAKAPMNLNVSQYPSFKKRQEQKALVGCPWKL